MKKIIISIIVSLSFAAIEFSGDARFRPRYDVKEYTNSDNTADFYFLYRGRLNIKADIGEGWFFSTKIGTNDVAGMTKMGSITSGPSDGPGNLNSNRPNLSFLELYYGYMQEDKGLWVGAFPLKYTPAYDLHFYSDKLVDIPFVLFNHSSVTGMAGYKIVGDYKLNWFLSLDENVTNSVEAALDGVEQTEKDSYILGLNSTFNINNITITPSVLLSFGEDDLPNTYGFDLGFPKFSKITSGFSYFLSDHEDYDANLIRFSASDGKWKLFYDLVDKKNTIVGLDGELTTSDDSLSYLWLSYKFVCYKSNNGSVSISPTYRIQNGGYSSGVFDEDYSRSKFEITTEIKFN